MSECLTSSAILDRFASIPSTQNSRKARAGVGQEVDRVQEVEDDDRLEDVELEVALRPGDRDRRVVAHHLDGDHRERLGLGRIDLARHDRGAGLVLGERELAETAARPGAEPAEVVGDLHERAGECPQGAARHDEVVVGGERGELVPAEVNAGRELGEPRGDGLAEAGRRVETGATAVPPIASARSPGKVASIRARPASSWAT